MSVAQIPNLPAVASVSGAELVEAVQAGTSVKVSLQQIASYTIGSIVLGAGTVTSVAVSGGNTGLTTVGGPITTNGTITLGGVLTAANGGTGASTLTGYVKGNGILPMSAASTIPNTDITGLGTMSTQGASAVAITGGSINGATIGGVTPAAGTFSSVTASSPIAATSGGTGKASYVVGDILYANTATSLASLPDAAAGNVLLSGGVGVAPSYGKVDVTAMISGAVPVSNGGTGLTSYAVGDILYASGVGTIASLSDVAGGNVLRSGGVGQAPSYGKVGLTTHVSGILPVANGGTGLASYAVGDLVYASATGALSSLSDIATGSVLLSGGLNAAPSYGKVGLTTHVAGVLPVANGGTSLSSYTTGDIIYASGVGTLSALSDAVTGNALISGGIGVAPSYGKIGLATHVTGILPVANGGTNLSSYTTGDLIYASGVGTLASLADAVVGNVLISGGIGVAPLYGKVDLTAAVTGILPITSGGTGANSATTARTALGLGTISTQDASAVVITGGSINGTTVGATTASTGAFTTVTTPTVTTAGTLSVSATGATGIVNLATNGVNRITVDANGVPFFKQAAPTSLSAATTLTAAQATSGIIQYTGAVATITFPTGTTLDAYFSTAVDMAFDLFVLNTGSGVATMTANTGISVVGVASVTIGTSGHFIIRRTAATTWLAYRVS